MYCMQPGLFGPGCTWASGEDESMPKIHPDGRVTGVTPEPTAADFAVPTAATPVTSEAAEVPSDAPAPEAPAEPVRPRAGDPKDAWVTWAVEVYGLDRGEAEALTKADLQEL